MKKTTLLIITIFISLFYSAQIASTASLIKKLNNSQFTIVHDNKASFKMENNPALKLIKKGTAASQKLMIALNDSTKIIMAHLVLCHIYFKVATFAGPVIVTENDQHISKYFLGKKDGEGMMISESKENDNYKLFVLKADRDVIINYWKNKLSKK